MLAGGAVAAGAGSAVASGVAVVGAGAPSPSPITASRWPTVTVSPSSTRISVRTPAKGDGSSESTLSVETSQSASSRPTASPTFLNHWMMMPSVTDSPSEGRVTSANVEPPSGQRQHGLAEGLGERGVRLDELGHLGDGRLPVDGEIARTELFGDPRTHHVDAEDSTR